jgi:hypothetical protein
MRNKDGSDLMVATLHEMDYWIEPHHRATSMGGNGDGRQGERGAGQHLNDFNHVRL